MIINQIEHELDLGNNHWLSFTQWKPDRDLNPQYKDLPDNDRIGGIISHLKEDGTWCQGSIWFDCIQTRTVFSKHPLWQVLVWEPLTCNSSFLCHCGDHGYIRNGKWET